VDTPVVIIVATTVFAAIIFLVSGMFRSRGGPKATDGHRWAAQATLAEMRKEGAGLPSDVGEETDRSEGSPGAEAPRLRLNDENPVRGS